MRAVLFFFPQKGKVGSIGVLLLFVRFEVFISIQMFVLTWKARGSPQTMFGVYSFPPQLQWSPLHFFVYLYSSCKCIVKLKHSKYWSDWTDICMITIYFFYYSLWQTIVQSTIPLRKIPAHHNSPSESSQKLVLTRRHSRNCELFLWWYRSALFTASYFTYVSDCIVFL